MDGGLRGHRVRHIFRAMQLVELDRSTFNRRFRVDLDDGQSVEAVHYRDDTLCVSSQVGCAVRCPFCASGAYGLTRPLRVDELWGQVTAVRSLGLTVRRTTVSGVGEPLHNHDAVRDFVLQCRREGIGPSLTSSGGPIARLREWLHLPHNGLTLSVHAGRAETRARMVPKGPSLDELYACLQEELPTLSRSRRKKVALAYLLVAGENDDEAELRAFAERALPLGLQLHLYAFNSVPTSACRPVGREQYEAAYALLSSAGLRVRMSSRARVEANGGCGTLVALKIQRFPARTPGSALP
jgi:23S rRNA (adenine2503-C2)-methyltransferase